MTKIPLLQFSECLSHLKTLSFQSGIDFGEYKILVRINQKNMGKGVIFMAAP
jgi:hypothetical protein